MGEPIDPVSDAITAFFRRALSQLARILLRYGISYQQMAELCKRVYVQVATENFGTDDSPATVSRVAMLTGMTRRDVRRYRPERDEADESAVVRTNYAARVLSGWFQNSDFCDENGEPLPLPESGEPPCFQALSLHYAPDIPAGTTLAALLDSGAVVRDNGLLRARSRSYLPGSVNPKSGQAILRSGSVFEDVGRTVDYNLHRDDEQPSRFERRATNLRMSPDSVDEFREFIEREGQAFLERVDSWLTERELAADDQAAEDGIRLGLGVYWIEEHNGVNRS